METAKEIMAKIQNYCKESFVKIAETETDEEIYSDIHLLGHATQHHLHRRFADGTVLHNRKKCSWNIPWFILSNCTVQISLHIWSNVTIYQQLMFIPELSWQYWRFISYTLLHSDLMHLLLNILLQCLVGISLECEQSHWKIGFVYIAGGISGSLTTFLVQPHLSLLGASAGIYSLLMSHIPHLLKNFSHLSLRYFRIIALSILCLSDIIFTLYHFIVHENTNPRICLVAHAGGAITGLLLGFILYSDNNK